MLTQTPAKADFYRYEVYFREAWSDLRELAGESLGPVLHRSALLMVRPEGLISGKLSPVHRFLGDNGYRAVVAEAVHFDRLLARELWRYQHTLASLDRLAVTDQMLTAGPALLLLLCCDGPSGLPATVRLSTLKGASDPTNRPPGTLRELLDQPNRLFALVHCADEPADLVRELGLLLDAPQRRDAVRALVTGELAPAGTARLEQALRDDERGVRTLDPQESLERVLKKLAGEPAQDPRTQRALVMLDGMRSGAKVSWRAFARELVGMPVELDTWDIALIGSTFIEYDEPGTFKLLGSPDVEAWRSRV